MRRSYRKRYLTPKVGDNGVIENWGMSGCYSLCAQARVYVCVPLNFRQEILQCTIILISQVDGKGGFLFLFLFSTFAMLGLRGLCSWRDARPSGGRRRQELLISSSQRCSQHWGAAISSFEKPVISLEELIDPAVRMCTYEFRVASDRPAQAAMMQ